MTQPTNHLEDEILSALIDGQLEASAHARAERHLASCADCQARLDDLRSVASMLRALPNFELPRDFMLGPRLVVDPPNVVRLRRWYTATRIAAASFAALFVVLAGSTLYVDSRPVPTAAVARPQVASAPAAAGQSAAAPTAAVRAAAPAAAPARPPAGAQPDDQVAAATSVNPLPTPVPTPAPTPVTAPVPALLAAAPPDSAAPLRNAAAIVGVLAVLTLFITVVVRHRLQRNAV